MNRRQFLPLLLTPALPAAAATDFDWPQWRGPERNGISKETGLLKSWPEKGPKKLWSLKDLGDGYGTVSIKGDRIYLQAGKGSDSTVYSFNRADGKFLWNKKLSAQGSNDRGDGPRGTPTIDGDKMYVLTENGELACMNRGDGSFVWRKNILEEYNGRNPHWLLSESPLIDGNKLYVTPGGPGAGIVALDKSNGKTIWASKDLSDPAGYSSCVAFDVSGVRCIATLTAKAGVGVRASDGKLMWRYEQVSNRTANIATAIFNDNRIYYTSAYGTGGGLLSLKADGGEVKMQEVYFNKDMMNHHGGVVLVNGYLYGFSNAILTCMEFSTGKVMWKDRSVGKGSLTYADGMLYLLGEKYVAGLAEATHEAYKEKGRFEIEDSGLPSWAHPVVCGGKLYLRNQGILSCYDIKA
jgi:outer membrane protein assembly factor BamB